MRSCYLALTLVCVTVFIPGCATTGMLPDSATKVHFGQEKEGKTGWSSYREEARFAKVSRSKIIEAAKAGLGSSGFALKRVDAAQGVVMGEHGMTVHDWNVIAGVYFREEGDDMLVAVLVEGSKDIGFSGDVTDGAWTGRILKGMRDYVKNE